MKTVFNTGFLVLLATILSVASAQAQSSGKAKLLELGWDIPNPAFMRKNIRQMEQSPFDGVIFFAQTTRPDGTKVNLSRLGWTDKAVQSEVGDQLIADLKATDFEKFTDNFVRVDMLPGDVDWFDSFDAIRKNMSLTARVAKKGGTKGVFLDTEMYKTNLFTYTAQKYHSSKSFEAYSQKVRARGKEVMESFQKAYPNLTVIVTFSNSYLWLKTNGDRASLSTQKYSLLPAFIDGLLDGVKGKTKIVDGFEASYKYRTAQEFAEGKKAIDEGGRSFSMRPDKYHQTVRSGFGLWLDADWEKRGWDINRTEQNYFQPTDWEETLTNALQTADSYVWIYSQKPNWWTGKEVSPAYPKAMKAARTRVRTP